MELETMNREVSKMIVKLNEYGWMHLDFHEDNVLCHFDEGVKYILIDWGLTFCVDDKIDSLHPVSVHYDENDLTLSDLKQLQKKSLDKWFDIVMEHSSFGSLEQKRRKVF